jgi:DNA-binding response OmpR family regulator
MNLRGKRVLVVEDDRLIALDVANELKSAGCTVIGPASRLEPAVTLAQAQQIDAAVLDIFLEGAFVWQLAGMLAAQRVPFIFLTGFGHALDFPPAFASIVRLEKPVRPGAIARNIASLLLRAA